MTLSKTVYDITIHQKCLSFLDNRCMTKDNYECTFPFQYKGHKYWTCVTMANDNLPPESLWCATDADSQGNFKSIGLCKDNENCPKSEHFSLPISILYFLSKKVFYW